MNDLSTPKNGKIAYLTGEYPKVSHTFILREITALRKQGADVLTCTVRRAPPKDVVDDQLAEQSATFCILEAANSPLTLFGAHIAALRQGAGRWFSALHLALRIRPPGLRAFLYQLFYFAEAGVLAQHLRHEGVTHLHNHFGNSSCTVAMLTSEISGIPYSFTEHGPAIFFEPEKWRIDEKVARAKYVIAISHFCRSQLMLFSNQAHWDKFKIVHCGVLPENYGQNARDGFGKRIVFVGRLDPVKGGPFLLQAFARLSEKHPDAAMIVVGDGSARKELEAQAKSLGVEDAVTFAGYKTQTEVSAILEEADMLVLPSFAEGVPVVLMEAMASNIPVIGSRVAGISELVEEGVSGYLTPPGDVDTLTARLDDLLSDPGLCREMGKAGRAKITTDFDIEKEAAWLLTVLRGHAGDALRP